MTFFRGAILAVGVLLAAGPLAEPQFVRFQLRDGVEVAGEMTAWDLDGIHGSFGQRSWLEFMPRDLWRLYVAVMDQSDPNQWVDLGRLLLSGPDGERWARRAFPFCGAPFLQSSKALLKSAANPRLRAGMPVPPPSSNRRLRNLRCTRCWPKNGSGRKSAIGS